MALESQVLGLSSDFTSCELCIEGKMPYEVMGLQGAHSPPTSLGCGEHSEIR